MIFANLIVWNEKCHIQSSTPQSLCDRFVFAPIRHRLSRVLPLSHLAALADSPPAWGAFSQVWRSAFGSHEHRRSRERKFSAYRSKSGARWRSQNYPPKSLLLGEHFLKRPQKTLPCQGRCPIRRKGWLIRNHFTFDKLFGRNNLKIMLLWNRNLKRLIKVQRWKSIISWLCYLSFLLFVRVSSPNR